MGIGSPHPAAIASSVSGRQCDWQFSSAVCMQADLSQRARRPRLHQQVGSRRRATGLRPGAHQKATVMIKTLSAPFRAVMKFPLVQLACVVAIILLLQSADDKSPFGTIFDG